MRRSSPLVPVLALVTLAAGLINVFSVRGPARLARLREAMS